MQTPKKLGKKEIGKRLGALNERIILKSSTINKSVSIPLLLLMEEAIENFQLAILQRREIQGISSLDREINYMIHVQILGKLYREIAQSISAILKHGFTGSSDKVITLPKLQFGAHINQTIQEFFQELYSKGMIEAIEPEDLLYHRSIHNYEITGGFLFILKDNSNRYKDCFSKVIELRELFSQKLLLDEILRSPTEVEVTLDLQDNVDSISLVENLPKKTDESDDKFDRAIRFFEANAFVPDWNSNLRELSHGTLKEPLVKSKKNFNQLKKENIVRYRSFETMDNFLSTFKNAMGIAYLDFFRITSELVSMCYRSESNVQIYNIFQLAKQLHNRTKLNNQTILATLKVLYENSVLKEDHCNIIVIERRLLFNFHRINVAMLSLPESVYENDYSNNLKGPPFEQACRNLFQIKGLKTLPNRVNILEPMLPPTISVALWGRQKKMTDLDVLASFDNILIVVECKKVKDEIGKQVRKDLLNSAIEHYYKARWIAENLTKLRNYLGGNEFAKLGLDDKRMTFIIPLMVTSKPLELEEDKIQPISYLELKEIDITREFCINANEQTEGIIDINTSFRKFSFPWVQGILAT